MNHYAEEFGYGYENKNSGIFTGQNHLLQGTFNPKQTYVGKIAGSGKDKNIDHLHINSKGQVGRHGGRYLSSH